MDRETQRHAACCALVHEVAESGNKVSLVVRGASMLPAVWPGDLIVVRPCSIDELRPGQIVLFHREGKLTAHRILNRTIDGIVTRGDSVNCLDLPVQSSEVVGRVESIHRNGRSINPEQSLSQRAASWMLRRSDLCQRATLYVARRLRRNWEMQTPLLTASPLPPVK